MPSVKNINKECSKSAVVKLDKSFTRYRDNSYSSKTYGASMFGVLYVQKIRYLY